MSDRESILNGLETLLSGVPGIVFSRNETRPQDMEAPASLVSLFDGDVRQRTPQNSGLYEFEHAAEVEIIVSHADAVAREAEFFRLVGAISDLVSGNPTLDGLADYAEAEAPIEPQDADIAGLAGVKFSTVPIVIWFVSARPTG